MVETIKTSVSISKHLGDQAETLARYLKISRNHLFGIAIENFIRNYQGQPAFDEITETDQAEMNLATQTRERPLVISQGDVYWAQLADLSEPESSIRHPYVVIQDNVFNHSRISTVVVCALTSNIKRANIPGNVLLEAGEAKLPRHSVVEVSKVSAIAKTQLGEYIGALTEQRVNQILAGMRFLQLSFFAHK